MKETSFTLGECHIVPAEEAVVVMTQPLNKTALPVATAVPAKTKRAVTDGVCKAAKKSKTDPQPKPILPEPDFALPGYKVLPRPVEVEQLVGKLVGHRFSVHDWVPGWCVGKVVKRITGKRWNGHFEVDYGKIFKPSVYIHSLLLEQNGKNWVLVEQQQ